jgi:hypothetical protein
MQIPLGWKAEVRLTVMPQVGSFSYVTRQGHCLPGGLCFAKIPSVRVVVTSGAAAMRGYGAQDGREASERSAEAGSGQDSRARSPKAIGRAR